MPTPADAPYKLARRAGRTRGRCYIVDRDGLVVRAMANPSPANMAPLTKHERDLVRATPPEERRAAVLRRRQFLASKHGAGS